MPKKCECPPFFKGLKRKVNFNNRNYYRLYRKIYYISSKVISLKSQIWFYVLMQCLKVIEFLVLKIWMDILYIYIK